MFTFVVWWADPCVYPAIAVMYVHQIEHEARQYQSGQPNPAYQHLAIESRFVETMPDYPQCCHFNVSFFSSRNSDYISTHQLIPSTLRVML